MKFALVSIFLLAFLLVVTLHSPAQTPVIDSLKNILTSQKNDTNRVNTLNLLSRNYSYIGDTQNVRKFASEALILAEKTAFLYGMGYAFQNLGYVSEMADDYNGSRELYNKALDYFVQSKNKDAAADVYTSIASSYNGEDNGPEALYNIYKALHLYEETGNTSGIAGCCLMIGGNNINDGDYLSAEKNLIRALKEFEKTGDKESIAVCNAMLSKVYFHRGEDEEALRRNHKAIRIYDEIKSVFNKGSSFSDLGEIYEKQGDEAYASGNTLISKKRYAEALRHYFAAVNVYKQTASEEFVRYNYMKLGKIYIRLHMYDSAKLYLDRSLDYFSKSNNNSSLEELYFILSKWDSATGNTAKAYEHFKLHAAYRDKGLYKEKTKRTEQLKLQYEFDKKEALTKSERDKKDAATKRTRNFQYTIIAGVLMLAFFLFVNNRQKQKAKSKIQTAYNELKSAQAQLIQSEKMASLGELTAGIAHEIQNPLNFVNNFSDVNKDLLIEMNDEIDKGNLSEAKSIAKDVIDNEEKINHHGKRADAIVKGMLQHSRSSSGVKEPTDINALCDEYLRLAYHGLRAKEKSLSAGQAGFNAIPIAIGIETDFDNSIGKINVIPQDIGRVLVNLINNAFYACTELSRSRASLPPPEIIGTGKGGFSDSDRNKTPTIWLSTKKIGDKVLIGVRDNGPGIPQKIMDKIFQPFFTTKPTGQGTGLGLSLAYDIVKAHSGEIQVQTTDGEGTKFIIKLPAQ